MKRALAFVLLAVALDRATGALLDRLFWRTRSGEKSGARINYALESDADVLVLGSSRAKSHVSPTVLERELGLSTFNAGINGQEIVYATTLFELWRESHPPPRAVVLHVDARSFAKRESELDRATVFAPWLDKNQRVRELLFMRPWAELKYLSRSYRFNGRVLPLLRDAFLAPVPPLRGFEPYPARTLPRPPPPVPQLDALTPPWHLKVRWFRHMAERCAREGTRLFLVSSPTFHYDAATHRAWTGQLETILAEVPGVEFIDVDADPAQRASFTGRLDLFMDGQHLNAAGAEEFSTLLARRLAERMSMPNGTAARCETCPAARGALPVPISVTATPDRPSARR